MLSRISQQLILWLGTSAAQVAKLSQGSLRYSCTPLIYQENYSIKLFSKSVSYCYLYPKPKNNLPVHNSSPSDPVLILRYTIKPPLS